MGEDLSEKKIDNLPKDLYRTDTIVIAVRVTTEISKLFHSYCKEKNISKGKFFSFLLKDYFQRNKINTIENNEDFLFNQD